MSKKIAVLLLTVFSAAALAPAAWAQDGSEDWQFHIAPLYLWAVDMGGTMTVQGDDVPVDVAFSDAFDKLETAFTVHFEAWKGDWALIADINYIDLGGETSVPPPGPPGAISVDLSQTLLELGAAYRFAPALSVIFGARYMEVDPTITLPSGPVIDPSPSWTDGFAGLLWRPRISERWTFAGRVDLGAGGSDLTVNASAMFDFEFGRWAAVFFGYRHLDVDYTDDGKGFAYDVYQTGPMAGLRFFW